MAIFNLTDIIFSKTGESSSQRLEDQTPLDKAFGQYSITRYPIELGNDPDRMHYVVFHINMQEKSQFKPEGGTRPETWNDYVSDSVRSVANRKYIGASVQNGGLGRGNLTPIGTIREGIENITSSQSFTAIKESLVKNVTSRISDQVTGAVDSVFSKSVEEVKKLSEENFLRTTKRTRETVALYMPNALQFSMRQDWTSLSMSQITGAAGTFLAGAENLKDSNPNLTPFMTQLLQQLGPSSLAGINVSGGAQALQAAFGFANNPQLELIYERPNLRSFSFNFAFYPRTRSEAQQIQKIIRLFRFHAAPEIPKNMGGRFLIPPSNFDIAFYYNGKENPNIPRISTCVLTDVNVQYATGSNYEVPVNNSIEDPTIGGTGMPYQITISLSFMETEIITKELIDQGNNNQGGY